MLEQLIESKYSAGDDKTRAGFMATTFFVAVCLCLTALLSSLFAMNLSVGEGDLELSNLIAPVAPAETKPEPPAPVEKQSSHSEKTVNETTRQANILSLKESPLAPNQISVTPNTQKSRPAGNFKITPGLEKDASAPQGASDRETNESGGSIGGIISKPTFEENKNEIEPVIEKKEIVKDRKTPRISGGVVNGKATSLPVPVYSAAAKAVKASGQVSVQVLIDKSGRVVSAKAVSGHPLLKVEAERAAKNARFKPTLLSNEPVEVTGIITYNFAQ